MRVPSGSRLRVGIVVGALVLGVLPAAADEPADATPPTPLSAVVARLGEEASAFDGTALFGISVVNLDTGERAEYEGDQWIKMASSLKVAWLAAAIRESGLEAVEPYGEPVMVYSVNESAGRAIDLAGGPDVINAMTQGLGMNGTLLIEWTTGTWWRSKYYPGEHPWLNYTTANDLVAFWQWLYAGQVLPPEETEVLLDWGRIPKVNSLATLMARLPDEVEPYFSYKMGVLPPGRSKLDPEGNEVPVMERDTMLGAGVIDIPGGPTYVFSVATMGGYSWWGKVKFVEYATCRIYEVLANETIGCDRSVDPDRTRLDTDSPVGGLTAVGGTGEFVTVHGWAADPDELFDPILTRFTIDGAWSRTARADQRHSWGGETRVLPGHGFDTVLLAGLEPGDHEVCAWAINDGAGPDTMVGCLTLAVR